MALSIVIVECANGQVDPSAREVVSAAQKIGGEVVLGLLIADEGISDIESIDGVDRVLGIRVPAQRLTEDMTRRHVIRALAEKVNADYLFLPASWEWLAAAACFAAEEQCALVSDVTSLDWNPEGLLVAERPAYAGKVIAQLNIPTNRSCVMLIKIGNWPISGRQNTDAKIELLDDEELPRESRIRLIQWLEPESVDNSLSSADVVFSIGRGVGKREQIELIPLAAEKCGAAIAASRPVVDVGALPRSKQVGQSGLTIAPRVYVAFGISGAPQHLVGMNNSGVIIAINTDKSAPIFHTADFGVVEDAVEVARCLAED